MYQELRKVLQYIVDKITQHKLAELHSQLAQDYEKVATASSPELEEAIKNNSKAIEEIQKAIEPTGFDLLSLHTFQRIDEHNVLGIDGINRFKTELAQISNNPRATSTLLQTMANEITKLKDTSTATLENLKSLWGEIKPIEEGYVELQVVFDDKVAIQNFKSMREQADFWNEMLLIANKALGDGTTDHQIIALYKINPSSVSFKTKLMYASLILPIVSNSLDIAKSLLGFKESERTIIVLPITNEKKDSLCEQIKQEEATALADQIEEATKRIIEQANEVLPQGTTARNEAEADTRIMLKKMYNFTRDGGAVSLINISEADKTKLAEPVYKLPEVYRLLQSKRAELENPPLPLALLSPEEEEKIKPKNLKPTAIIPVATETPKPAPKKRGRKAKAKIKEE